MTSGTFKTSYFDPIDYTNITQKNLEYKKLSTAKNDSKKLEKQFSQVLKTDKTIKAVSIAFSDIEGRLHMLDYDKDYFIDSYENLTFDGSSVRGFSTIDNSDLRLAPDWKSFRFLPPDVFGSGKVLIFAFICTPDGKFFPSDFRGRLQELSNKLQKKNMTVFAAPEIEGFLLQGIDAEQHFQKNGFELVTQGGYFNTLPQDEMRLFIDKVAEVQRALGFENEKDHGEVAPSTFEINFKYAEGVTMCDQTLLYKLIARQVAKIMGMTATFLPKPISGINGSGMHTNISIADTSKNLFWDEKDPEKVSKMAKYFIAGILTHAKELCLIFCPSVNSYRRLDPNYEAPNAIKYSACDRTSMIRIPLGNKNSARVEVRSASPDANPYLSLFSLVTAGLEGIEKKLSSPKSKDTLPGTIREALAFFNVSPFMKRILGKEEHKKYFELKKKVTNRSPALLGTRVKTCEIIYHHEITNQILWEQF